MHELFWENVNLHRLRNKFNFSRFEAQNIRKKKNFSGPRLQSLEEFIISCRHSLSVLVWRCLRADWWLRLCTYYWNININMYETQESDGSLNQGQFVRCSEKVKRDLSASRFLLFEHFCFACLILWVQQHPTIGLITPPTKTISEILRNLFFFFTRWH